MTCAADKQCYNLKELQIKIVSHAEWCETRSDIVPSSFTSYVDLILCTLEKCGVGCHTNGAYVGALEYADDLTQV